MNSPTPQDIELLSAYLDGELPPAQRAALEARLQSEPALQEALRELSSVVQAIQALPTLRAPKDFTLSVEAARAARTYRPAWRAALSITSAAAALLVSVLGVWLLLQPLSAPTAANSAPQSVAILPTQPAPTPDSAVSSRMAEPVAAEEEAAEGVAPAAPAALNAEPAAADTANAPADAMPEVAELFSITQETAADAAFTLEAVPTMREFAPAPLQAPLSDDAQASDSMGGAPPALLMQPSSTPLILPSASPSPLPTATPPAVPVPPPTPAAPSRALALMLLGLGVGLGILAAVLRGRR